MLKIDTYEDVINIINTIECIEDFEFDFHFIEPLSMHPLLGIPRRFWDWSPLWVVGHIYNNSDGFMNIKYRCELPISAGRLGAVYDSRFVRACMASPIVSLWYFDGFWWRSPWCYLDGSTIEGIKKIIEFLYKHRSSISYCLKEVI